MLANNPYKQYKHDSVYTATPTELTLMLYNGAIKFIMQSDKFITEKDFESANSSIIRAEDIINELRQTLDMKYEISKNFKTLYDFIYDKLLEANLKKDAEPLKIALKLVSEFRDTWQEAMKLARMQEARTGSDS